MDELIVKARKKALTLLTDKDRTTAELRERLQKSGFAPDTVDDAIAYVSGYGYLDDDRYARHYVEVMSPLRSRRRIIHDLAEKGLSSGQIEAAFKEFGDYDETPLIRQMGEKKLRSLKDDDPKKREKLIRFLSGKGFRFTDILSVTDDLTG